MPSLNPGEWHHLVFVYSVSQNKKAIYLDGNQNAITSNSIDKLTSDRQGSRIGFACDGTNFDGKIDEIRVWNRVLSNEEIKASFNSKINNLYHKFTDLEIGEYSYYAYTIDTDGNEDTTEIRDIEVMEEIFEEIEPEPEPDTPPETDIEPDSETDTKQETETNSNSKSQPNTSPSYDPTSIDNHETNDDESFEITTEQEILNEETNTNYNTINPKRQPVGLDDDNEEGNPEQEDSMKLEGKNVNDDNKGSLNSYKINYLEIGNNAFPLIALIALLSSIVAILFIIKRRKRN
jgi:hypothetical protein